MTKRILTIAILTVALTGCGSTNAGEEWEPFRDIDGHTGCMIKVGDTSIVKCADGFITTS